MHLEEVVAIHVASCKVTVLETDNSKYYSNMVQSIVKRYSNIRAHKTILSVWTKWGVKQMI